MSKPARIVTVIVLLLVVAVLTFQITFSALSRKYEAELRNERQALARYNKLLEVDDLVRSMYLNDLDDEELMDGILRGYVYGMDDKYAEYYSAEDFRTTMDEMSGDMQGIGINVIYDYDLGVFEVVNIMPDSPAMESDLEIGDLITTVGEGDEEENVADLGYYVALARLRGKEGTTAIFTVYRPSTKKNISFRIPRRVVTVQSVNYHTYALDKTIGIIRITGFDKETPKQFYDALTALTEQGCKKLVVDDRNNPGGELSAICSVLDLLLPEGPVIRTVDRDGKEETIYYSDKQELNMPIAVLVNGSTASAGELFCAALQDYKKAVIVGVQTYGKGCMQTVRSLSDGSGIAFTYRLYNPPFSPNYDGIGVTPDVIVEPEGALLEKSLYKVTDEEDNQLAAAVKALNQ
ncbi:MAG: S41 family peptidase [Clostridia bacterium]|nr:S41 family peptidase [Clostridia bacterium]